MHSHIGSGNDPNIWKDAATKTLDLVEIFLKNGYDIQIVNLGGGFKVKKIEYEKSTDLIECGKAIKDVFEKFFNKTGKRLKLEIEPGNYLVASSGCILAKVIDIKKTNKYQFLLVNSGMNEITRPMLYGSQHSISLIQTDKSERKQCEYVICGHCCESGDLLTPKHGEPEVLNPRKFKEAKIGDLIIIGGSGSYCSSMSCANYNSYPRAPELLIENDKQFKLIRKKETLQQIIQNEII